MTQEPRDIGMSNAGTSQESEVRIEDYFFIILRSKWLIMAILLVAVITAFIKNDFSPPVYEASVKIWVKQQESQPLEDIFTFGFGRATRLETLRELIKSRRVAQLTEEKLDLSHNPLPKHRGGFGNWVADVLGIKLGKTKRVHVIGVKPYTVAAKAKDLEYAIKEETISSEPEAGHTVTGFGKTDVEEGEQGFRNEDLIVEFNDTKIEDITSLRTAISTAGVGKHLVKILRGGLKRILVIDLQETDLDEIAKASPSESNEVTFEDLPIGLTVQNASIEMPKNGTPPAQLRRRTIEGLLANLSVEPVRDTDVMKVTVKSGSRERSRIIADTIAEIFQEEMKEDMQGSMTKTVTWADARIVEVDEKLKTAQENLKKFEQEHGTILLDEEAKMLINRISDLEKQIDLAEGNKREAEAKISLLLSELNKTSETVISAETLSQNTILLNLRNSLIQTETQLEELKAKYTDTQHTGIEWLKARKAALKEKIANQTEDILSAKTTTPNPIHQKLRQDIIVAQANMFGYEAKVESLENLKEDYNDKIQSWPDKKQQLFNLQQDVSVHQRTKDSLIGAQESARIASYAEPENVKVWDKAVESEFPVSPRKRSNLLLGALIGLTLGVGLAFLREYLDNTYPTLEDAVRDLESLPVSTAFLGMIPAMEETEDRRVALMTHDDRKSGASEAFRIMRTKLQFIDTDSPPKVMLVTSSTPAEGKTTVASNLAISLAQMEDKKVLIIDADMRRPALHKSFPRPELNGEVLDGSEQTAINPPSNDSPQLENPSGIITAVDVAANLPDKSEIIDSQDGRKPGLSELVVLMNEKKENPKEAINEIVRETEVENLFFIASGTIPPNPSELLSSENMKNLIPLLRDEYDYIVIDSPPVKAVADPAILASMVDCAVYVFDIAKTKKYEIRSGLEALMESNPRKIGTVCNLTEPQHSGYYGYGRYGYSKYGYYGRYRYMSYYYYYYYADDEQGEEGKSGRKKNRKDKKLLPGNENGGEK